MSALNYEEAVHNLEDSVRGRRRDDSDFDSESDTTFNSTDSSSSVVPDGVPDAHPIVGPAHTTTRPPVHGSDGECRREHDRVYERDKYCENSCSPSSPCRSPSSWKTRHPTAATIHHYIDLEKTGTWKATCRWVLSAQNVNLLAPSESEDPMSGDGANDAPAISHEKRATDIILTEPGLATIIHTIRGSRIILECMRSCSTYACAITIRIVVCSTFLVFAFHYDFPPLMVLIIALLNNGTVMTPDLWDSEYVWDYRVLIVSSIALIAIVLKMSFFHDNFGVMWPTSSSGPQSHKITYLQVAIIS
ncbi:hypothetical protein M404DRAFT_36046 [Pisolithus tinctorius Marx 270]|uniref:Uncharacterized protein n=1 Tax=Pisolithus tinctorius Marx 270 TaxID=870435 RepID=A0A0C3ND37_PISTI|nr:hypothetical protein M404DRAFT_36046 [Pisolithus tinctorius Marx 270]